MLFDLTSRSCYVSELAYFEVLQRKQTQLYFNNWNNGFIKVAESKTQKLEYSETLCVDFYFSWFQPKVTFLQ